MTLPKLRASNNSEEEQKISINVSGPNFAGIEPIQRRRVSQANAFTTPPLPSLAT